MSKNASGGGKSARRQHGEPAEIRICIQAPRDAVIDSAVRIAGRVLHGRAVLGSVATPAEADLVLTVDPKLPHEGYSIQGPGKGARIAGGDSRGLLYGVGRWLQTVCFDMDGGFRNTWNGVSAPATPLRGIYFATHFWNYYDEAPLAEIKTYLEDLALWGCNGLKVWFDLHHFNGISDPRAREKIARLRGMMEQANQVGMSIWLGGLSNEAYANSPEHLRADWTCGHDGYDKMDLVGHYHRELCPNKPGALELMMQWRAEVLDAFAGIDIRYFGFSSYDQGGCTCPACAPWGINGLLKVGKAHSALARKKFPGCKVIMSTWRFDQFINGEWEGLHRLFAQRPDWLDGITIDLDHLDHVFPKAPGGLDVFCVPEISMHGMIPWGGYGANPMPERIKRYWDKTAGRMAGAYPYSEGIYEDLNKIVALQLQWSPGRTAEEIVSEYAEFYFGAESVNDVQRGVAILEGNLGHYAHIIQDGQKHLAYAFPGAVNPKKPWTFEHHSGPLAQATECRDIFARAAAGMPAAVKKSWRWRILWLRSVIDAELSQGPAENDTLRDCFRELARLYYAENSELAYLVPPLTETYEKLLKKSAEIWL